MKFFARRLYSRIHILARCAAGLCLLISCFLVSSANANDPISTNLSHPRLYCTRNELAQLRQLRRHGIHAKIYKNLMESADWCLTKTPRTNWIAPISPDPIYENLYDRFYGIMGDLAITEHMAFAYALSGKKEYGEAARNWVLASCRAWQREAEGEPDGGKAYAVSRLLKGIAVGYDLAYDQFTEAERKEIREMLVHVGRLYFDKYFQTPTIAGPDFHTHHATVEWSSFGVMALALLNETPEAQTWVEATGKKFEAHLLPSGLAPDSAQVEGGTFWASTMQYRIFFMDALRRVTGRDLFKRFKKQMNADLALASVASEKFPGYDQNHANVVLEPYYGQLDYYAPVLLFLAREYRQPTFQYLALWDHSLGQLQKTRAITPHGEQLLFELGGYAYLWFDKKVPARAEETKLSYHFSSIDEAYLRASWKPDDLLVGVSKGQVVVHAGGLPVLVEPGVTTNSAGSIESIEEKGSIATIRCGTAATNRVEIELNRTEHKVTIHRWSSGTWQWSCHGKPIRRANELRWKKATLRLLNANSFNVVADGWAPLFATGFNKLKLLDPAPMKFPLITVQPSSANETVIEIRSSVK